MESAASIVWRAESRPCPLCEGVDVRLVGVRGGWAHRRKLGVETTIVRCTRCDLLYTRPTLLPEGNPYAAEAVESYFSRVDGDPTRLRGQHYARLAEQYLGAPGRMLEVGCGLGYFLEGARDRGWQVRGVDFTPAFADAARSRGIEVECSEPGSSKFLTEQYDCILMLNILEHLYRPREVLAQVFAALRPGGVVAIGVPNEGGLSSVAGRAYFGLRGLPWAINMSPTFPPFHVVGFTPASLRYGLEGVGFEVLSLETVSGSNSMPASKGWRAKLESAGISIAVRLAALVKQGDALDCWARRPL